MAKIVRKTQKIFGSNAGLNQIAQFGSLAAAAPTFTTDPDTIQALANYLEGWFSGIIGSNSPAIEDMNALFYLMAYQIAYGMQSGVPEYDASTTYYIGSIVNNGLGKLYVSTTDNNINNPLTSVSNWARFEGMTQNENAENLVVPNGYTYSQPTWIIPVGATWTIDAGGYLSSFGPNIVLGTLIINGTVRSL